ncbi:T9SS C-terminal target domain-containing protein [Chryseobacterium carnipullorum]|uniref:Por secretion system C-terminal sorting domain n=1 Tax=Chryseobacterium carnipullorum TaxID=1124835 RepID=A0A376DNY5_CHRCU|nr:lamin tail domain-containing protein [Chryseobacterium carnipullorum]AZA48603.1 T9SS C-terminal target domain-containing protein [Chryseobacterium carnipullorum]AZA63522.1 T9SS C-terminal target domain-containing protein [Chryseobacterium carnipullorum]STC92728.1 Por secretion system C-terminal sorting domain [Chryseobacterium carnipullorum]
MKKIFTVLGLISATAFMNAQIVINEVYGGGGNSGASYKNDFVELKNIGTTSITLTGAYLQYASAIGTFNGGTSNHALPTFTLAPGQTYLIQEISSGANGATLPTPDASATINLSGSAGKIALTSDGTAPTSSTSANVIDYVGYGTTTTSFEGTGPAPAPSNTNSIARVAGDTNNNATDFVAGAPTPKNSTTGSLAVSDVKNVKAGNFVKNTFVKSDEITFGADVKDVKVYNMFGQVVKSASVKQNGTVNVAELAKGNYIVTGTVNNEPVSQKILKD